MIMIVLLYLLLLLLLLLCVVLLVLSSSYNTNLIQTVFKCLLTDTDNKQTNNMMFIINWYWLKDEYHIKFLL